MKKLTLLLQQIQDVVVRENFRRIKDFLDNFEANGGVGTQGPPGPPGAPGSAGVGVPAGGTTGQVLAKNSNTNYDTAWVTSSAANPLIVTMTATVGLSALQLVRADSLTHVSPSSNNGSYELAQAIGITLGAASPGGTVQVLLFGKLDDPFFTFTLGATLFVGISGAITTTAPLTGHLTQIGHSLGSGSIFINIEPPVTL